MPNNEALQVFYGSVPLILVLVAGVRRGENTLKAINDRLSSIERRLNSLELTLREWMPKIERRLSTLETRVPVCW